MAEINNVQLKDFCNGHLRPIADKMTKLQGLLDGVQAEYNARDLGTIINAGGASNLITDGSETDGRTRVAGGDVYNLITLLSDLDAFFTSGRIDVLYKWQVNGLQQ